MKKNFIYFILLFSLFNCFAQEHFHYVLENGLEIYIIEDKTNPMSNIILNTKAGYSNQKPNDTGFFELYSRMFWTSNPDFKFQKDAEIFFQNHGVLNIKSQCNFSNSLYSASFPANQIDVVLNNLSNTLKSPNFQENILQKKFNELKNYANDYSENAAGFINSTIDSKIYKDEPWVYDTSLFPSLKNYKNINSIRGKLIEISNNYYIPNNCAIFISSPYNHNFVFEIINNHFKSWIKKTVKNNIPKKNIFENIKEKKFVLVSKDFSKEVNQIIMYFLSNEKIDSAIGNIFAHSLENPTGILKTKIANSKELGHCEHDLSNITFSQNTNHSKIIFQALIPQTNTSIINQINITKNFLLESSNITKEEFVFLKNFLSNQEKQKLKSSFDLLYELSDKWSNNYFSHNITEAELCLNNYFNTEPFIFILAHTDTYKKNKSLFDKNGYIAISNETKNWYNNFSNFKTQDNINTNINEFNITEKIVKENYSHFEQFKLQNGIPVALIKNKNHNISFSLNILGGELNQDKRALETIVINALTQNIKFKINSHAELFFNTDVFSETNLQYSNITIETSEQNFEKVLQCFSNALIYGDVTHAQADELMNAEKYKWRLNTNDMFFQQKLIALQTLYSGTKIEKISQLSGDILLDVNYNHIRINYASLLNAKKFFITISCATEILSKENIEKILNDNFGLLKSFDINFYTLPEPIFSEITIKQKLKRIFTSDIPADKAPQRPLHLIPTTEFLDPARVVIKAPPKISDEYIIFYALLLHLENLINHNEHNSFEKCHVEISENNLQHSSIIFSKCKSIIDTKKIFDTMLLKLKDSIRKESLHNIKTNCISHLASNSQTNNDITKLLSINYINTNKFDRWIEEYLILENASTEVFNFVFEKYFSMPIKVWIFSSDTSQKSSGNK
ncbi:MAG: insulinase family protein [Treponema sp.]|nr:insulinase family protein [Treponema sp.]